MNVLLTKYNIKNCLYSSTTHNLVTKFILTVKNQILPNPYIALYYAYKCSLYYKCRKNTYVSGCLSSERAMNLRSKSKIN